MGILTYIFGPITDRLGLMLLIRMLNEACWGYMKK